MFVGRSRKQRAATTTTAISSAAATAALIGCTLLLSAHLGSYSAWAMSIDRLAVDRTELQQLQTKTQTPADAASDNVLVVDDMQLEAVPAVAGDDNTDMYVLVPANIAAGEDVHKNNVESGNSIDEKQDDEQDRDTSAASMPGDMLMLETDDTPGMQMVELPSVVHVADEAVLSANSDDNEVESVPEMVEEAIEQLVASEAEVPTAAGQEEENLDKPEQQADEIAEIEEAILESTTPLANDEIATANSAEEQQIVENVAEKVPQILATIETAAADEQMHDEPQEEKAQEDEAQEDKASTDIQQISNQDAQDTNADSELEAVTEVAQLDAAELGEQEAVTESNVDALADAIDKEVENELAESVENHEDVQIEKQNDDEPAESAALVDSASPDESVAPTESAVSADDTAPAEEEELKENETAEVEATTEAPLVSEFVVGLEEALTEELAAEAAIDQTQIANDEPKEHPAKEADQETAEVQQDEQSVDESATPAAEPIVEVATTEAPIQESQPEDNAVIDEEPIKVEADSEQHIQSIEIANIDNNSLNDEEKVHPEEHEQLQPVTEAEVIEANTPSIASSSETAADEIPTETAADEIPTETAADKIPTETAADEIPTETAADEIPTETAADKIPTETAEEAIVQPVQASEAELAAGDQSQIVEEIDDGERDETVMENKFETNNEPQTTTELEPVNLLQMDDIETERDEPTAPIESEIKQETSPVAAQENAVEDNSLLTTIVQVPTQQQVAPEIKPNDTPLKTTTPTPLSLQLPQNVADSVLNYVNASFIQQTEQTPPLKSEVESVTEAAFNAQLRRYDGAQVWRIVVQNDKDKKMADELQTKYDGQLWKEVKQEVDYLLKPQVLAAAERHIRSANLSRIVLIDNLQQVIEVENPSAEEIVMLQNRKGHRLSWQAYHRLEDIHGFIDYMAKTYPDICSTETIGYSVQKRPLKILKISNGNASNPSIWLDGGMHAREWISPATVTFVANQLIEGWEDLPEHMRQVNYYLHPVANPDGYEYSHTTDRLWRKNLRSHGRQCPGVDLNRNFGYKWGGKGTSASPCSQTYRGSKAFSEPETFYISKFISSYPRNTFQAYLSFHSYGQYILYPWGYDYHLTTDRADLDRVARQAGTSITKSTGVKYTVGSSATTLYPAAGGSDDWAKGIAGIKYAYTVEMGDTGRYGFVLPARFIHSNGKDGYTFIETVARAIIGERNKENRKRALKARRA